MKTFHQIVLIMFVFLLVACSSPTPAPTATSTATLAPTSTITFTPSPLPTLTSTLTSTPTSTPTITPSKTPTPSPIYIILGPPIDPNCGNNNRLLIWANSAANGPYNNECHFDLLPSVGCNPNKYTGEVLSPIPGTLEYIRPLPSGMGDIWVINPPKGVYPEGFTDIVSRAWGKEVDLGKVTWYIDIGHVVIDMSMNGSTVEASQQIGELFRYPPQYNNPYKLAISIAARYPGLAQLYLAPDIVPIQGFEWGCAQGADSCRSTNFPLP